MVIGGSDFNTNTALLVKYFKAQKLKVHVLKTIERDLKSKEVFMNFGFDTTELYLEMISL